MWQLRLLSDRALLRWAGERAFQRGKDYARAGRVHVVQIDSSEARFIVRGTLEYSVYLEQFEDELIYDCTCPVGQRGEFCKHCVAAALVLREAVANEDDVALSRAPWRWQVQEMLKLPAERSPTVEPHRADEYFLLFLLEEGSSNPHYIAYNTYSHLPLWQIKPLWASRRRLQKAELLTDDESLPQTPEAWKAWIRDHRWELRSLLHHRRPPAGAQALNLPPESLRIARWLTQHAQMGVQYSVNQLADLLDLLATWQAPVYRALDALDAPLQLIAHHVEARLSLSRREDGLLLRAGLRVGEQTVPVHSVDVVTADPAWLLINNKILAKLPEPATQAWLASLEAPLHIPSEDEDEFRDRYLPRLLRKWGRPLEGGVVKYEYLQGLRPQPRLYLEENRQGTLVAHLRFAYGDYEVPYDPAAPETEILEDTQDPWKFLVLHRDREAEAAWHREATTTKYGLKRGARLTPAQLQLRARISAVDFLLDKVPKLAEAGFEIFGEEKLKKVRVNRHRPTLTLNITSGIDWFDVQAVIAFGDQTVSLAEIRRALRKKRRYVKLADGSIGRLPEEWLERYKRLFGLAEKTDDATNTFRFADFHAAMLETLAEEAEQTQADQAFRERLARLKDFQGMAEHPLPHGLRGDLRPYQVAGYQWLHFLHDYGFGGILADDMGLGKTVQVLAFLLSLRERRHSQAPDLIVVPRSLLVNWQREVEKFTPDLKVLTYFGPQRPFLEALAGYDVVLTTYGVMRVDNEALRQFHFHYVVLDESQAIKNPLAKTARAARRLQSDHRLAITGTPVENNTFELWAQFAFVMPGLLGSLDYFKEEFVKPIEKKHDTRTAETLRRWVYPFILRRTKEQVAPELPPRTERIIYCSMEPAQRRFYLKLRDYYRDQLLGLLESEGLDKSRMKILEGLLRLRQASNHPRLIDPDFRGDSGKMEVLLDTLETLQSEGHKALVFSQFVEMLKIIRTALDARGVPYAYLDGSTRDRQAQVDRFQEDPTVPFFLISLKAGGLGLNLTAADYVIHVDPWWNPAVERQASDRAHRIGQDKPVFIFKLITRESVEEKILQLQEQKKALVEQLITTESGFLKELTAEDIEMLFG